MQWKILSSVFVVGFAFYGCSSSKNTGLELSNEQSGNVSGDSSDDFYSNSRDLINRKFEQSKCSLDGWTLDEKLGQLLWIGVKKPDDILKFKPSGVVLFKWNYKNLKQLQRFNKELQDIAKKHLKAPLFIGIDHEGGKINRLGQALTPFPDASSMGTVHDPELVYQVGKIMGSELRALGINTNLAPVLDLGDGRTFLENRIWGQDPTDVSLRTEKFIQGLKDAGVMPVPKHFPGHAGTRVDAHFKMPVIKKKFDKLWSEDLLPFQSAIGSELPGLMTAHVEVPAVDRGPASLSKKFLNDILREKLGFNGLIVTDDLEMGGVFNQGGGLVEEAALKAFRSGTDQLLVVWSDQSKARIVERIKQALLNGEIQNSEINEKVCRVLATKMKWVPKMLPDEKELDRFIRKPSSIKLAREISSGALNWIAGPESQIHLKLKQKQNESWRVALTYTREAKIWNQIRPRDEVFILGRRPDALKIQKLNDFMDKGEKQIRIILTSPRHSIGDEAYNAYLNWILSKSSEEKRSLAANILWIHKGLSPVLIKSEEEASKMPIGIMSLNGGMPSNLDAFFEWIQKSPKAPSEKIVLNQSLGKDLATP